MALPTPAMIVQGQEDHGQFFAVPSGLQGWSVPFAQNVQPPATAQFTPVGGNAGVTTVPVYPSLIPVSLPPGAQVGNIPAIQGLPWNVYAAMHLVYLQQQHQQLTQQQQQEQAQAQSQQVYQAAMQQQQQQQDATQQQEQQRQQMFQFQQQLQQLQQQQQMQHHEQQHSQAAQQEQVFQFSQHQAVASGALPLQQSASFQNLQPQQHMVSPTQPAQQHTQQPFHMSPMQPQQHGNLTVTMSPSADTFFTAGGPMNVSVGQPPRRASTGFSLAHEFSNAVVLQQQQQQNGSFSYVPQQMPPSSLPQGMNGNNENKPSFLFGIPGPTQLEPITIDLTGPSHHQQAHRAQSETSYSMISPASLPPQAPQSAKLFNTTTDMFLFGDEQTDIKQSPKASPSNPLQPRQPSPPRPNRPLVRCATLPTPLVNCNSDLGFFDNSVQQNNAPPSHPAMSYCESQDSSIADFGLLVSPKSAPNLAPSDQTSTLDEYRVSGPMTFEQAPSNAIFNFGSEPSLGFKQTVTHGNHSLTHSQSVSLLDDFSSIVGVGGFDPSGLPEFSGDIGSFQSMVNSMGDLQTASMFSPNQNTGVRPALPRQSSAQADVLWADLSPTQADSGHGDEEYIMFGTHPALQGAHSSKQRAVSVCFDEGTFENPNSDTVEYTMAPPKLEPRERSKSESRVRKNEDVRPRPYQPSWTSGSKDNIKCSPRDSSMDISGNTAPEKERSGKVKIQRRTSVVKGESTRAASDGPVKVCSNEQCRTEISSTWRMGATTGWLCNACGLYLKRNGRDRPVGLVTKRSESSSKSSNNNN